MMKRGEGAFWGNNRLLDLQLLSDLHHGVLRRRWDLRPSLRLGSVSGQVSAVGGLPNELCPYRHIQKCHWNEYFSLAIKTWHIYNVKYPDNPQWYC